MVSGFAIPLCGSSNRPAIQDRSTQATQFSSSAPEPRNASFSCVETVKQFARHLGFSRQLALCRRESSCSLYQHRWACYHLWCSDTSRSVSNPSISKLADFLLFLWKEKHLSVLAIRGYRSTLSALFKYRLPDICANLALRDLLRSFELERPSAPVGPPSWDLVKILEYLRGPIFELLSSKPLQVITVKTLFLLPDKKRKEVK